MTDKSALELMDDMKAILDNFDKATETGLAKARKARIRGILEECASALTDAEAHPGLVRRINTILENYPE